MNNFSQIYCTLFYTGLSKWAPGSVGSLFSIIILFPLTYFLSTFTLFLLFIILFAISYVFIFIYSKNTSHDAKEIVIDEFLGILLIMCFYDYLVFTNFIFMNLLIFILFRLFDIFKPFPINWIDKKFINTFGIILDDIIAAIYCIIILMVFNVFI